MNCKHVPERNRLSLTFTGTLVCAMWRDKHFYHGRILSQSKGRYQVAFEDGDVRQVKATDVFVCELLAVGQQCLAERDVSDVWF